MGAIDREYLNAKRGDKPTTQDFILSELRDLNDGLGELRLAMGEVRDLTASLGELRKSLSEMWRQSVRQQEQIEELQEDVKSLRALSIDIDRPPHFHGACDCEIPPVPRCDLCGSILAGEGYCDCVPKTLGEFTVSAPPEWYT